MASVIRLIGVRLKWEGSGLIWPISFMRPTLSEPGAIDHPVSVPHVMALNCP